jgi:hypothetical protein
MNFKIIGICAGVAATVFCVGYGVGKHFAKEDAKKKDESKDVEAKDVKEIATATA